MGFTGFVFPQGMDNIESMSGVNGMGGHVRKQDPDALKVIVSKKIVEFEANFFVYNWLLNPKDEFMYFTVKRDKDGNRGILSRFKKEKLETDELFFDSLQEIIEKYQLICYNGLIEYSIGVPPQCQGYWMKVTYDSGEKLSFTIPGNSSAPWCHDLRKALCDELVRHGIEDLLPPKADRIVHSFLLKIHKWPEVISYCSYCKREDPEGRALSFTRSVWNKYTKESEVSEEITSPEGFYERLSKLEEETQLWDICNGMIDFPRELDIESDLVKDDVIGYSAQGESGRQFNYFDFGERLTPENRHAADLFRSFLDSVFESAGGMPVQDFNKHIADQCKAYADIEPVDNRPPRVYWTCTHCGHKKNFRKFCEACDNPRPEG